MHNKNMLKYIAAALVSAQQKYVEKHCSSHSECTTKNKIMVSYNISYASPDLIDFFGDYWKMIRKQI